MLITRATTRHEGAWEREEISSYCFSISALDVVGWSASCPDRDLPPEKEPPAPFGQVAVWAPELVWTQRLEEKFFDSAGIEPRSPGRPVHNQTLY
jgi:hypothetical protein